MIKSKLVSGLTALVLAGCASNPEIPNKEIEKRYYLIKDHEGKEIKLEMEFDGKNYYIPIFGGVLPYKN